MKILLVTWDGGGNLPPMLGLGNELAARGHRVSCLGPEGIRRAVLREGIEFLPLELGEVFDPLAPMGQEAVRQSQGQVFLGDGYAADLAAACALTAPDLLVIDCFLVSAQAAAERLGLRFAILGQTLPGWILPFWDAVLLAPSNEVRVQAGLPAVASTAELWARADRVLVATMPRLDGPLPAKPAGMLYTGPIFESPIDLPDASVDEVIAGSRPRVLLSFSTTFVDQVHLLAKVIAALSHLDADVLVTTGPAIDPALLPTAANVSVHRWLPHAAVLPHTALVISHGGHSSVARALSFGVPLLCLPQGNDQGYVSERVAANGAGLVLEPGSDPERIASATSELLQKPSFRDQARRLAAENRAAGPGRTNAASAVELLL